MCFKWKCFAKQFMAILLAIQTGQSPSPDFVMNGQGKQVAISCPQALCPNFVVVHESLRVKD